MLTCLILKKKVYSFSCYSLVIDVPRAPDAVDPPVASRYPQRVNRHPPKDSTILFRIDVEHRMYSHKEGNE